MPKFRRVPYMNPNLYASDVVRFFRKNNAVISSAMEGMEAEKIYELYCLKRLLDWIEERYNVNITFYSNSQQNAVHFKMSPGKVNRNKYSYFVIKPNRGTGYSEEFEVHVDTEVITISEEKRKNNQKRSFATEIDIILIKKSPKNCYRPMYTDLLLGVECKFQKGFGKNIVRECIGTRYEISTRIEKDVSLLLNDLLPLRKGKRKFRSNYSPASILWIAQIQDKAKNYRERLKWANIGVRYWRKK